MERTICSYGSKYSYIFDFNFYKIISFLMMEFSERKDDNDG